MNRTQGGLTLIEIIVVLAALAILAAILIPTVISLPEQAEEARAGNDARAIGEAIYNLQRNLAKWPVYASSVGGLTNPANATLQRLNSAGNAPGVSGATADWIIAANTDDLDDHLATNRLPDASQYPTTGEFAWRGPYLAEAPADPWGNRFIVNVQWLQPGASPNGSDPGQGTDAVLMIEIHGTALGGTANGITMIGHDSVLRGLAINNFGGSGVLLLNAMANTVGGNFIGTNVTGTAAEGNGVGITVNNSHDNTIGTTARPDTNLISGNGTGIIIIGESAMNLVRRNLIGTQADGVTPLGNTSHGILITGGADCNTIGGIPTPYRNIIAFNGGDGVALATDGGINNYVDPNYIHDNGGLGVDINDDGPTPNDDLDVDAGPNEMQNYPVLTSAVAEFGGLKVTGSLNSTPYLYFNMFFLVNDACDASGYGEGQMFVDERTIFDSDGDGQMSFSYFFNQAVAPGKFIAASASNPESTSEFSQCVEVQQGDPGTSTPTPSASPTPTATPTGQTPTPTGQTATPTPTGPAGRVHGDIRCDGEVDATDSLGILREVARLPQIAQTEPCPDLGDNVSGRIFGDVLCNGGIDAVDALAILRFVAGLSPPQPGMGCPSVGEEV